VRLPSPARSFGAARWSWTRTSSSLRATCARGGAHCARPPERRTSDFAFLNDADGGEEIATIAWCWAAIFKLGLQPEDVFHGTAYPRGDSPTVINAGKSGNFIGFPLLQVWGMAYDEPKRRLRDVDPFPHMSVGSVHDTRAGTAADGRDSQTEVRRIRLYSRKKDPKTGKRRNLGTFRYTPGGGEARARRAVLQAALISGLRVRVAGCGARGFSSVTPDRRQLTVHHVARE